VTAAYLDTWCVTCRTWHSSVWVHLGNRMVKVNDVPAPLLEVERGR
jgi:hypothetical protein